MLVELKQVGIFRDSNNLYYRKIERVVFMCEILEFKQPKTLTPEWKERAKEMAEYVGETLISMAEDLCEDPGNPDEINELMELFLNAYNEELVNYISNLEEES